MSKSDHVHEIGSDMHCACGFVLRIPPISVSVDVMDRSIMLVQRTFNCESVHTAIRALRDAADELEQVARRSSIP